MPTEDIVMAQETFMASGGLFVRALATKRKSGELPNPATFRDFPREYPKMLRISQGVQEIPRSTEDVRGKVREWTERKEVFDEIVVGSEEEEERVLAGGKTSAQLEDDRRALIARCRDAGIKVDLAWSTIRLRRELGEKLDAPEPVDDMGRLEEQLATLKKMAAMKAEIEALQAQLSGKQPEPEADIEGLRAELVALGVTPDKRWGLARLREELDAATAPRSVAA